MDRVGVYSQILYPNILGFIHSEFLRLDPALLLEIVRAYNDYQTEFCAADPARLHPMTSVPWWDVPASIAELERCAEFGHKGMLFAWEFERNGLPPLRDPHWEPLLKTCEEMGLAVSFHIGFGGSVLEDHHKLKLADRPADDGQKTLDMVAGASNGNMKNSQCVTELIMGRICHRYPTLKFVSVESGMGYVPFMLEQLDYMFMNTSAHVENPDMLLPSEYFRRQIYGTFWFESDIARLVDLYPENFMFETDYPHPSGLIPGTYTTTVQSPRDTITTNLAELPEDLLVNVLQDNAARVYNLEPHTTN
jgi:predicted TIM-barrel fold metal-dependent hydrolase